MLFFRMTTGPNTADTMNTIVIDRNKLQVIREPDGLYWWVVIENGYAPVFTEGVEMVEHEKNEYATVYRSKEPLSEADTDRLAEWSRP